MLTLDPQSSVSLTWRSSVVAVPVRIASPAALTRVLDPPGNLVSIRENFVYPGHISVFDVCYLPTGVLKTVGF